MAVRPESGGSPIYYEWASSDQTELQQIEGVLYSLDNKTSALPEYSSFGLRYGEPLRRQEFNWYLNGYSQWIQHLDQRYAVGDLHYTTSAESVGAISTRLGGTWVLLGTETVNATTVNVYQKTV